MLSPSRWIAVLAAASLTAIAAPAFPQAPQSREEALAGLEHADAGPRAEAIAWIANHGSMADAPLLHARLRDEHAIVRAYAEQGLWLLWSRSGDAEIDALMARGAEAMQGARHDAAIAFFSEVVQRKPEFAEGWNRRATAYFLAGAYERSIADCAQVLRRNPSHFGALSGLGEIYLALERHEEALAWFRRALEVNPNLTGVELRIRQLEAAPPASPRAPPQPRADARTERDARPARGRT